LSIPVLLVGNTVGKGNCCELDVIEKLKVEGELNLFAIFPIGATIQDSGKRKRSGCHVPLHYPKEKEKENKINIKSEK